MNRGTFAKAVVPGLFSFMVESFMELGEDWKKIVQGGRGKPSKRAYEESAFYGGFGYIPEKPEGTPISYDNLIQGPTKRWVHTTYGLGAKISEELIEDTLYPEVGKMESISRELGRSARETLNVITYDMVNNGTATTNHTVGDGLALFSNDHTSLGGGTWSNLLSPGADLSATSLQNAIDNFETTNDGRGKRQQIKATQLLVSPQLAWKAKELLNSGYDPETANNAINAIKERNIQLVVSPYLTDTDGWTLFSQKNPIIAFMRRKITFAKDGDFETGDFKTKVTFRHSVEANNPLGVYHSAGA